MAKGKGRGWHGDSAGHAAAARKSAKGSAKKRSKKLVSKKKGKYNRFSYENTRPMKVRRASKSKRFFSD